MGLEAYSWVRSALRASIACFIREMSLPETVSALDPLKSTLAQTRCQGFMETFSSASCLAEASWSLRLFFERKAIWF